MIDFKSFLKLLKTQDNAYVRSDMPQIRKDQYDDFIKFLTDNNIKVSNRCSKDKNLLQPTQRTFKDLDLDELRSITDIGRPILICKRNRILDGHHRWLVTLYDDNRQSALVTIIHLDTEEALNMMKDFCRGENKCQQ